MKFQQIATVLGMNFTLTHSLSAQEANASPLGSNCRPVIKPCTNQQARQLGHLVRHHTHPTALHKS